MHSIYAISILCRVIWFPLSTVSIICLSHKCASIEWLNGKSAKSVPWNQRHIAVNAVMLWVFFPLYNGQVSAVLWKPSTTHKSQSRTIKSRVDATFRRNSEKPRRERVHFRVKLCKHRAEKTVLLQLFYYDHKLWYFIDQCVLWHNIRSNR